MVIMRKFNISSSGEPMNSSTLMARIRGQGIQPSYGQSRGDI
jgi:hypothetical protein